MQHCLEKYEINKICRCCLKNIGSMNPLYGFSLDKMLRSVTSLQVVPNDGLPELMCCQCILQLSQAYRFIDQCRKSNTIISEFIKNCSQKSCVSKILNNIQYETTITSDNTREHTECPMVCEDDHSTSSVQTDSNEITLVQEDIPLQTAEYTQLIDATCNDTEFQCRICKKTFSSNKQLMRHIKTHDDNKPFKCTECDKTFSEKSNMKKHFHKHTGELRNATIKPQLCSLCGKAFKYSSSLSKHMKFHTGKNLSYCPHCPKYYADRSALKIHLRCHTGERPHACNQCDRQFSQASNLQKHLRSHSGERPFKCFLCEKTFVEREYLSKHMGTHNSEKKALCSVCGRRFANSKTLDAHMRTHASKRIYLCGFETCNKTFMRLETALIHRRIHTGERPFSCDVCSHSFTTSTQLSSHSRTHTGEKPFACELCPKKFVNRNTLMSHANKHNSTQTAENTLPWADPNYQELNNFTQKDVSYQQLKESVLLYKINQNGGWGSETECSSIPNIEPKLIL